MNDVIKHEGIKLAFSLLFISLFLGIMYFAWPKVMERGGAAQAKGFWRNEIFQNRHRLFGGGDDAEKD